MEQHALEASPGLLDPINRLEDFGYSRPAFGVELRVTDGEVAVDDFPFDEPTLEIGRHQVDAAHLAAVASGVSEQRARGRVTQCGRENLLVIDAFFKGSTLYAEPSFGSAISFLFVHPNEFMDTSTLRDLVPVYHNPRLVVAVIA